MSSSSKFFTKGFLAPLFAMTALSGAAAPQIAQASPVMIAIHAPPSGSNIDKGDEARLEKLLADPATKRADLVPYTMSNANTRLHEGALKYEDVCRKKFSFATQPDPRDLIDCMETKYGFEALGVGSGVVLGGAALLVLGGLARRKWRGY